MNENLLNYNKAISLIHQGHLDQAEEVLKVIAQTRHGLSNWALGLVYAATGRPFEAIKHWKYVSPDEVEAVSEKMEKLLDLVPVYEKIFTLYNRALEKARQNDLSSLPQMYADMIETGRGIPLPVEIYKGLFLSLLVQEKRDEFNKALNEAPEYVRKDPRIKSILLRVTETELQSKVYEIEKKSAKKIRKAKGILIAGAASLVLAAGVTAIGIMKHKGNPEEAAATIKTSSSAKDSQSQEKKLRDQISSLTKDNAALQADINKKTAEMQNSADTANLLQLANVNLEDVKEKAALKMYQIGMESYKKGQYQAASEKLQKSLIISKTLYFADDAQYYLIDSLNNLGETAASVREMDTFLSQSDSTAYKQSPYLDDVMLLRAESYLQAGDKENAGKWLDRIISEFPDQWTSKKAKTLETNNN
ncbi:MAG: tetratricopeptide repeat protein [Bacillota bacterium]|nr:tetratricopeptide repeat protein [Bacillota bacterium]